MKSRITLVVFVSLTIASVFALEHFTNGAQPKPADDPSPKVVAPKKPKPKSKFDIRLTDTKPERVYQMVMQVVWKKPEVADTDDEGNVTAIRIPEVAEIGMDAQVYIVWDDGEKRSTLKLSDLLAEPDEIDAEKHPFSSEEREQLKADFEAVFEKLLEFGKGTFTAE